MYVYQVCSRLRKALTVFYYPIQVNQLLRALRFGVNHGQKSSVLHLPAQTRI